MVVMCAGVERDAYGHHGVEGWLTRLVWIEGHAGGGGF